MKIVFIGCVQLSWRALKSLIPNPSAEIVGVITRSHSNFNSDFFSLQALSEQYNIPCLCVEKNDQKSMMDFVKTCNPDVIYCFGWSYLLSSELLNFPRLGVVGYHPAALPLNRGRHPLIWTLVLGLTHSASTFFFMDEGADSGDILSQVEFDISLEDDAAALYEKVGKLSEKQIHDFTEKLSSGTHERRRQNHALANYWRKRSAADGAVDWRAPASGIYNLIRGLTKPYIGAHCVYQTNEIKLWRSLVHPGTVPENFEHGKILDVVGGRILVKCGVGAIWLVEHAFINLPTIGEYL